MRLHGRGIGQLRERLEEQEAAHAALQQEHAALRKSAEEHGSPEELARALEEAREDIQRERAAHGEALRQRDIRFAVRSALQDAWDISLAEEMLDREGLELLPDGRVEGLDARVDALREARPFLFRTGSMTGIRPAEGMEEECALTLEAIAGMTPRQINENWAAVARTLNRNT